MAESTLDVGRTPPLQRTGASEETHPLLAHRHAQRHTHARFVRGEQKSEQKSSGTEPYEKNMRPLSLAVSLEKISKYW